MKKRRRDWPGRRLRTRFADANYMNLYFARR